jgi:hypothetical protein
MNSEFRVSKNSAFKPWPKNNFKPIINNVAPLYQGSTYNNVFCCRKRKRDQITPMTTLNKDKAIKNIKK